MLKLIYTLREMADALPAALVAVGAKDITINRAHKHKRNMTAVPPLPEAVVSFWLDSTLQRQKAEQTLAQHTKKFAGYFVTESRPLNNPAPQEWFTQIAFLKKPEHLERQDWLRIWLDEHTKVAIETQSTFYYAQNIVARCLHQDAPDWDAIIEERFPLEALTNDHVFFDASSDAALEANRKAMLHSCGKFIDFRAMNVVIARSRCSP